MNMRIEDIIYETTRELFNVEEKLRIATVFLFCQKLGSVKLSEFLYCNDHELFIQYLNNQYSSYDVDFSLDFKNPNIKSAFFKTLDKVKEKWDDTGFLKALSDGDEFAKAVVEVLNYDFDKIEFYKIKKEFNKQLKLNF